MADWRTIGAAGEPGLKTSKLTPKGDGIRYRVGEDKLELEVNADFVANAVAEKLLITSFGAAMEQAAQNVAMIATVSGVAMELAVVTERNMVTGLVDVFLDVPCAVEESDDITAEVAEMTTLDIPFKVRTTEYGDIRTTE